MASDSHLGGPTAFRQNRSTVMTLSRPLRPTPLLGSVLGGPVTTKGINSHRCGKTKTVPNGDKDPYKNNGHARLMPSYLAKVAPAHNLPSLEAPARGMKIDPVRTFR